MGTKSETVELLRELDLTEAGYRPGPSPVQIEYTRDLTEADMAALAVRSEPLKPPSLLRIHSSHHALARCLAAGMRATQAGLVTGYSTGRIGSLQADPAFQALVADYRAEIKGVFADLAERMNSLSLDAIELLHERLHESPGEFSIPMLLDVVKAFADRTGHGPGQTITVGMNRDFIDRPPRENFEDWQRRRLLELEVNPTPEKLN